jgi:2-polyprenyl-3-methyl-5-hydroxy-6-metoxy-1,4-benzoquinol methylase
MNKAEKFWDRISINYDKSEKNNMEVHLKVLENTKRFLNASDIALDYGCATGTKAFELAGNVRKIQGIDISSKMIAAAKRKAVEHKVDNVDFTQATIFDERYKRESFDVIFAFYILHAVENNRKTMQRIEELLKPGGLLISTTLCLKEKMTFSKYFQLSFYLLLIKIGLVPNILTRFENTELENLIANGNLKIVESEKIYQRLTSYFIVAKKI